MSFPWASTLHRKPWWRIKILWGTPGLTHRGLLWDSLLWGYCGVPTESCYHGPQDKTAAWAHTLGTHVSVQPSLPTVGTHRPVCWVRPRTRNRTKHKKRRAEKGRDKWTHGIKGVKEKYSGHVGKSPNSLSLRYGSRSPHPALREAIWLQTGSWWELVAGVRSQPQPADSLLLPHAMGSAFGKIHSPPLVWIYKNI